MGKLGNDGREEFIGMWGRVTWNWNDGEDGTVEVEGIFLLAKIAFLDGGCIWFGI